MDEVTRILIFTAIFTLSAAILIVLSFIISRRRKVQHEKQLLDKEYKTREDALLQVSRDLHDEIGSSLSGISLFTQIAGQKLKENNLTEAETNIEKAGNYTAQVIEKVSDMAWLLKPNQESLSILIDKLKTYSHSAATSKNIQSHFDTTQEFSGKELSIRQRKAIYLISKEAINNAVKYATCNNIYYRIYLAGNTLKLQISDDGKGFLAAEVNNGNGLKNMRARAEEINAIININSEPGRGTTIEMEI